MIVRSDVKDKELGMERMIDDLIFRVGQELVLATRRLEDSGAGQTQSPISLILWIIWISLLALRSL